jgi:hypothetical protein
MGVEDGTFGRGSERRRLGARRRAAAFTTSRACSLRNCVMSTRWRGWRAPPMYRAKKSSNGLP